MINYIKNWYEEKKLAKYYRSIHDIPMYNWISIYEQNDLTYLSKTRKLCKRYEQIYDKLQDQLIDEFGINEDFIKVLRNRIKIELYYAEQIRTKDRSNQIFIDILQIEIDELIGKQTKGDLFESVMAIEKFLGFKIDAQKISVYEFYRYAQIISNKTKHH